MLLDEPIQIQLYLLLSVAPTYTPTLSACAFDSMREESMNRGKRALSDLSTVSPAPSLSVMGATSNSSGATHPASFVMPPGVPCGSDLEMEGKISGDENLRIDGAVEAPISLKCSKLTVGRMAEVTAKVVASEVIVYGKLNGTLLARDRIEIKKDGWVIGDLTTARIFIEDGAYFKGNIQIERRKTPRGSAEKRI